MIFNVEIFQVMVSCHGFEGGGVKYVKTLLSMCVFSLLIWNKTMKYMLVFKI